MLRVLDFNHHLSTGAVGQRRATTDFAAVKAAGCAAVINRTAYGTRIDELATEHNRRADAAGLPRMFFGYQLSRQDPRTQAEIAFHYSGGQSGRRGWCDIEESAANDGQDPKWPRYAWERCLHINETLAVLDSLTAMPAGIYSSKTYLDFWFTSEQQASWAWRPLWVAHYNTAIAEPWIPAGWKDLPVKYWLWQDRVAPWPGVAKVVDQNRLHPAVTLEALLGTPVPAPAPEPAATIRGHATRALELLDA